MMTHTIYEKMTLFPFFFFFYGDAGHDTIAYAYNACSVYSLVTMFIPRTLNTDDFTLSLR